MNLHAKAKKKTTRCDWHKHDIVSKQRIKFKAICNSNNKTNIGYSYGECTCCVWKIWVAQNALKSTSSRLFRLNPRGGQNVDIQTCINTTYCLCVYIGMCVCIHILLVALVVCLMVSIINLVHGTAVSSHD